MGHVVKMGCYVSPDVKLECFAGCKVKRGCYVSPDVKLETGCYALQDVR